MSRRLTPSLLDAIRDQTVLSDFIGQHVALKRHGREWTGCCPFHDDRHPSFSVNNAKAIYKCFSCGAGGDVIDFTMHVYRLPFIEAVAALASRSGLDGMNATIDPITTERREKRRQAEAAERERYAQAARRIWSETLPAETTPVEIYLRSRGITDPVPPALRYHPELRYKTGNKTFLILPAMVGAITNTDGDLIAVHRTFLKRDGSGKADVARPKSVLGDARGGGVSLAASNTGSISDLETLNVTEGIETGLSLQQMTGVPTVAAWSTGGLMAFQLQAFPAARHIIIGADNDRNEAGLKAAQSAALRWTADGREVQIRLPQAVGDWNDVLRAKVARLGLERPINNDVGLVSTHP